MSRTNPAAPTFDNAVTKLVTDLTAIDQEQSLDARGNPEDQLKAPLTQFLNDAAEGVRKFVCEALIEKEFHR